MTTEDTDRTFVAPAPPATITPSSLAVPHEKLQEYERGIALLMNLTHERDMARSDLNAVNERCRRLEGDLIGKDTQIESLKNMLAFTEDQVRIKEAECSNLVLTYRNERDQVVQQLADARAKLQTVYELVSRS